MAARQRLRMVLEARRASRPCWRCALNLPRHISSSLAGNPGSSNRTDEAPYSRILQQGFEEAMKSHFPDLPPHGVKPALRVSGMDKRGSIRRVRRPRVRRIKVKIDDQQMASAMEPPIATTQRPRITQVMSEGRPVPLRVRLKFFASAPQEPRIRRMSVKIRGQKVASGTEPQSNSMATLQRPRIARIISEVRPVPFRIRSVFIASVSQEPRIRRINVGLDGQQVVSGTEPQSKSMVTMQIPRIARVNSESRPAYVRTEPKSKPIETTQKPRIRLMQDGPTMPLRTESETTSLASQKPRIRVMQDGRTVPLRSQPLVVSLYKHMARMRGIRVDTPRTGRTRLDIRHMSVMADGQQVASSTDLQFKSTETTQKLRTRHIQEKSDDQQVTSSTRSQSRPKRAVNRPRIRIVSTGPPVVLGTRGFPRSEKVEQLLPLRKIRIARSISKEFFVSKCGLDPVIRPFSSMTPPVAEASLPLKNKKIRTKRLVLKRVLFKAKRKRKVIVSERALDPVIRIRRSITPPVAKGPDVVSNKFTRLKVGPVVRKCIDTYDTPSSQEDEACHDELTSVLDVYKDLHKSDLSNPTRETRYSFSSTRFSPQNNVTRRIALSESRTLNQPSLSTSNRSFSSTTGGAPNRRYATATVSKRRPPLVIRLIKSSTGSDYAG